MHFVVWEGKTLYYKILVYVINTNKRLKKYIYIFLFKIILLCLKWPGVGRVAEIHILPILQFESLFIIFVWTMFLCIIELIKSMTFVCLHFLASK